MNLDEESTTVSLVCVETYLYSVLWLCSCLYMYNSSYIGVGNSSVNIHVGMRV